MKRFSHRRVRKHATRILRRKRAFAKRMGCDPRRWWPADSDQYLDWYADQSGDFNLKLKRLYREGIMDLLYERPLYWGLVESRPARPAPRIPEG